MKLLSILFALCCAAPAVAADAPRPIRLSTTTSTEASGLLGQLLPQFEAQSGMKVHVIAVGTGKALELAKNGDVDVALVHAREAEDKFVAAGYGVRRHDVMYNDFVLLGPPADPAAIGAGRDVLAALRKIVSSGARFVSRGDASGTEQKELGYWAQLGVKPQGAAYVSAGQGMMEVLNMASQMQAYTLSDRATFAAGAPRLQLRIVAEGDSAMLNPYGVIAVNPARHPGVNAAGAQALIDWLTGPRGQAAIAGFKIAGKQVFFPSAQK
ncbi:MAG TPA: substrate-binding domain-containing protein [Burkholderiaceae bacterium]